MQSFIEGFMLIKDYKAKSHPPLVWSYRMRVDVSDSKTSCKESEAACFFYENTTADIRATLEIVLLLPRQDCLQWNVPMGVWSLPWIILVWPRIISHYLHNKAIKNKDTNMKLLQMDFPFDGPGKDEMNTSFQDLAKSIAGYPGLIWKIWTVNEGTHEGGGIYLFEDEASLNAYAKMHTERLKGFGVSTVSAKVFDIPEVLTRIARGQLTRQHDAVITSNKELAAMRLL